MTTSGSRRPTLRDVADAAEVSIKTASRVVNGEAGVSAVRAERVRAAVQALGYVPDAFASSLRRGDRRTRTVAVLLDDLANPFAAAVHRAVVDITRQQDVLALSASTDDDPDVERDAVQAFTSRRVDGLVVMPGNRSTTWREHVVGTAPHVVLVDRPAPPAQLDLVTSDHRAGAEQATRHLLHRGHRRIAFLGEPAEVHSAAERLAGFRTAMGDAGSEAVVRTGVVGSAAAEQAVVRLLSGADGPTALFTSQNALTVGAVRGLRSLGLQRRVALVGFDDIPAGDLLDPGVTVVAQQAVEIGVTAARQLLGRIAGDTAPAQVTVVPTRLLPRGSGEIRAPGDLSPR